MPETEETKAAVEYWDQVAASSKRRAVEETAERNPDRTEQREALKRAAALSRER